jgi:NAD(P)-dependent dehydrogenase (short-subunit alcohol dehydrogenase family)
VNSKVSGSWWPGATKGAGKAIADRFLQGGGTVITTARSAPDEKTEAHFIQADVSTSEGTTSVIHRVLDRLQGIDIIVHNVGGSSAPSGGFITVTDELWQQAINENLVPAGRLDRGLLPSMIERGSGLLFTSRPFSERFPCMTQPLRMPPRKLPWPITVRLLSNAEGGARRHGFAGFHRNRRCDKDEWADGGKRRQRLRYGAAKADGHAWRHSLGSTQQVGGGCGASSPSLPQTGPLQSRERNLLLMVEPFQPSNLLNKRGSKTIRFGRGSSHDGCRQIEVGKTMNYLFGPEESASLMWPSWVTCLATSQKGI